MPNAPCEEDITYYFTRARVISEAKMEEIPHYKNQEDM